LRHSTLPARQRQRFDLAAAQDNLTAIEQHTNITAARADALLSDLAVTEMAAAVADIKQTVATMKANALGDAAAQLGKPQRGESA
jgi:cell pole-organizing protein PopZ